MRRKTAWLIGHIGLPVALLTTTSFAWQLLLMQTMSTENELLQLNGSARAKPPRSVVPIVHGPAGVSVDVGERAYADIVEPLQDAGRSPLTEALNNGAIARDRGDSTPWK